MINLDQRYHKNSEAIELDQELTSYFPSHFNSVLDQIDQYQEPQMKLMELSLSLITMTFQYFALLLASEYLVATDETPDMDTTNSLLAMIRRPGPGKWVEFIRIATRYFSKKLTRVVPEQAIQNLITIMVSKKRPMLKIDEQSGRSKKLDYCEALINIRNRFAHSRHIGEELAQE